MGRRTELRASAVSASAMVVVVIASVALTPLAAQAATVHWPSTATTVPLSSVTTLQCAVAQRCVAEGGDATVDETSTGWTSAHAIENLPEGATVAAVDCFSSSACVVGGSVAGQGFLLDEHAGVWGQPQLLSGAAPYEISEGAGIYESFTSAITVISCTNAGACTAGGNFTITLEPDGGYSYAGQGFVTRLNAGTWSGVADVSGVDGVTALSCVAATSCTLAGYQASFTIDVEYPVVSEVAETATERAGVWGAGVALAGLSNLESKSGWLNAEPTTVNCVSAGNCTIGGWDQFAPDFDGNPVSLYNEKFVSFVVHQVNGAVHTAVALSALSGSPLLACDSALECVAASGTHVELEHAGTWRASTVTKSGHQVSFGAVSCTLNGPCVVAGAADGSAYAMTATAARWSAATHLGGLSSVAVASCVARVCAVAGGDKVIVQQG